MRCLSKISCVKGDITEESVDAIVNAANEGLRGGGGVDGAIHRAAGPLLLAACRSSWPEGCPTGEARPTPGFDLPARHVIHCVGPIWSGGFRGEDEQLASAYSAALRCAEELSCRSVAFPAISCGVYRFPHERAAEIALTSLARGLELHQGIEELRMVLFSDDLLRIFEGKRLQLIAAAGQEP